MAGKRGYADYITLNFLKMEDNVKRIAGEIASLKKTIIAREKVLAKLLKESGEPLRQEKLKSTDLAPFLEGDIKVKFGRGQDEYIGQLTECDKSSITLENVKGRYASRAEYHVWNEEEFWPMLRDMDDMSAGEIEEADAFDRLPGIVTREAHRIKWYCKHGIDCFGWIEEGLAIRVEYRYLKAGEIIEDGDEVEMSNTIHDPALWVPAANTVGQEAPDPAYVSHRKYRRLV